MEAGGGGLKAVTWNVAGTKNLWLALNFLRDFDVVMIQESWVEASKQENLIKRLNKSAKEHAWYAKPATRINRKGRGSGGQIIGIKKSLSDNWKVTEWSYGLVLKKKTEAEKVWIISVYNNVGIARVKDELKNLVLDGGAEGATVIVAGDLNARIGLDQGVAEWEGEPVSERTSQDPVLNSEGKKLLSLCEEVGLIIQNGRAKGDEEGVLTLAKGGYSVLDLVLTAEMRNEPRIELLRVIPRTESDHLPVMFVVSTKDTAEHHKGAPTQTPARERMRWSADKRELYQQELHTAWANGAFQDPETPGWEAMKKGIRKAAGEAGMIRKPGKASDGPRWFNGECREQRKVVWRSLKNLLKVRSQGNKRVLSAERKKLKRLIERTRQAWIEKRLKEVAESTNLAEWWTAVNKFRPRRARKGQNITKQQWRDHFAGLLGATTSGEPETEPLHSELWDRPDPEQVDEETEIWLNADFAMKELKLTLAGMKNKKAAGEDEIAVEFIKAMPEHLLAHFLGVLNRIWVACKLPVGWEVATIIPIFKSGDENNPKNYRGISLLDAGYKILANLMARRLSNWVEKKKRLRESQAGFRPERGTREHIFVLNSLINQRLKVPGGRLYVAFIDFKAAFDTVDRTILMEKLWRAGIRGRMHSMIREIHRYTVCEVLSEEGVSARFQVRTGVRQGCPLSPILFNLMLDDIDEVWERGKVGGSWIGATHIQCLKFADDVALVAENPEDLQRMLRALEKYADRNRLVVSEAKTKIMVFRNGGKRLEQEAWKYKGHSIEVVSEFKYLGYWFSTKGIAARHLREMTGKAQQAANAAWGVMKRAKVDTLRGRLYLMDSIVRSAALYGVEVWGWSERKVMEGWQARFVKMAMGVAKNTPNYIWRIESGRFSTKSMARMRAGRYILDILALEKDRWPVICLREEVRGILNGNPSRWGKELNRGLEDLEAQSILRAIWKNENIDDIGTVLASGLEALKGAERAEDWRKVTISSYNHRYQVLSKRELEDGAQYWRTGGLDGWMKETWARLRCGNIGRAGKKGYRDWSCRLCRVELETLEHVWVCPVAHQKIKECWVEPVKAWVKGLSMEELNRELTKTLCGMPRKELCAYAAAFEKLTREGN